GLLNWKIGGLFPLENLADVYPEQTERLCVIASVDHENAGDWKLTVRINSWHRVVGCPLDEPITLGAKKTFPHLPQVRLPADRQAPRKPVRSRWDYLHSESPPALQGHVPHPVRSPFHSRFGGRWPD